MGIFDRFRRTKQDDSVLPAEVDQYYQSEKRERRGVAVLLGIITLVITLVVSSGLFYGGRYAYRKITDKDKTTVVQTNPSPAEQGTVIETNPSTGESTPTPSPTQPAPAPSPAPTPAPAPATPSTGDELPAANLPRTGDEGM